MSDDKAKNIDDMTDEEVAAIDEGFEVHPTEYPAMIVTEDGVISEEDAAKYWDKENR